MSWIDTFLSDGDPHRVVGADARTALSKVARWRDLIPLWMTYARRLPVGDAILFMLLDLVRRHAYARGFRDGTRHPWRDRA